jgi:hypothetical protein
MPGYQAAPTLPGARPLTPEEDQEFQSLLNNLSGTKDAIKGGKNWVMYHVDAAQAIAAGFLNRMRQLSEFTKKQHVVYLINDVLFHRYGGVRYGLVLFCCRFALCLTSLLLLAADVVQRLAKILPLQTILSLYHSNPTFRIFYERPITDSMPRSNSKLSRCVRHAWSVVHCTRLCWLTAHNATPLCHGVDSATMG